MAKNYTSRSAESPPEGDLVHLEVLKTDGYADSGRIDREGEFGVAA
jgi:hypothetical protein